MNTKGMKFLAVLAVLAMAFAAFAVIAPDTGSDADGETVSLTIVGGNDAVSNELCADIDAAVDYLEDCTDLAHATAIKIKMIADLTVTVPVEGGLDYSGFTEIDLNGKILKFEPEANAAAAATLTVSPDLVIKNSGNKGFVEFGTGVIVSNPVDVAPEEITEYYVVYAVPNGVTVAKKVGNADPVPVTSGTAIAAEEEAKLVLINNNTTAATVYISGVAQPIEIDAATVEEQVTTPGQYVADAAIAADTSISTAAQHFIKFAARTGLSVTLGDTQTSATSMALTAEVFTINYTGPGVVYNGADELDFTNGPVTIPVAENAVLTVVEEAGPSEITFDSVTVNMVGTSTDVINILGSVNYYGTVGNVTFKTQTRSTVTFCQGALLDGATALIENSDATFVATAGATVRFVGNMLTVNGTIKGGAGGIFMSTLDDDGNATTPAFKLKLPTAVVTVKDQLDITGSMEADTIELNGKELYVHQASSLKVVDFTKNTVDVTPATATTPASGAINIDDGRFGVDAGATFTITGYLYPFVLTGSYDAKDVVFSDFTYNSYAIGSVIANVNVAVPTATVQNPEAVYELQAIPMFTFLYTYITEDEDGNDVQNSKLLSMMLPSNNKFPSIKVFVDDAIDMNAQSSGNYIKEFDEVLIGWTDVEGSKTVKYNVGDAFPETLAAVYYPIYESDISDLSISGTVDFNGKATDAQYLYGKDIVATKIGTNTSYSATVAADGSFQIVNMKSGTYNISVPTLEEKGYDVIAGGSVQLTVSGVSGLIVNYQGYVDVTINVSIGDDVTQAVAGIELFKGEESQGVPVKTSATATLKYDLHEPFSKTKTQKYYAEAKDANGAVIANGIIEVSFEDDAVLSFVLHKPTYSISGKVTNADDEPMVGVHVVLTYDDTKLKSLSAVTDAEGKYKIVGILNNTAFDISLEEDEYRITNEAALPAVVFNANKTDVNIIVEEREWFVYLSIYYNGEKIILENYQQLTIYYNGEAIPTNGAESQIEENDKTKTILIDLKKSEAGLLFVQAESYNYIGNMSKQITATKQTIEVTLGVLTYNLFGIINAPAVDPLFDMESCLTITTNAGVVTPDQVVPVSGENIDTYWKFYVTGLTDQTTGDVAIKIGKVDTFKTFKIESKDIGDWTFTNDDNLPLTIAVELTQPKVTVDKGTFANAAVNVYTLTGYDEDKNEVYEPVAADADGKYPVNFGAKVKIKATPAADEKFIVTVDKKAVELDKDGYVVIGYVTGNTTVALSAPPVYTEDLLVTLGQKDKKVVVVFTALDHNEKINNVEQPRTIPAMAVDLELNYSYINEFGDVTADSYKFSVAYDEIVGQGAAFKYSTDDFATKLGDNYQYAFSITGSYVFGEETVKLSKTAYKPVPAAEA
jgi:hypothetical protein